MCGLQYHANGKYWIMEILQRLAHFNTQYQNVHICSYHTILVSKMSKYWDAVKVVDATFPEI